MINLKSTNVFSLEDFSFLLFKDLRSYKHIFKIHLSISNLRPPTYLGREDITVSDLADVLLLYITFSSPFGLELGLEDEALSMVIVTRWGNTCIFGRFFAIFPEYYRIITELLPSYG
jgi:hypothetical protein